MNFLFTFMCFNARMMEGIKSFILYTIAFTVLLLVFMYILGIMPERTIPWRFENQQLNGGVTSTSSRADIQEITFEIDQAWKTHANSAVVFRYPHALPFSFIEAVDWPPYVEVFDAPYLCTNDGDETKGREAAAEYSSHGYGYCVSSVTEETSGSMYTQYAYAFGVNGKTALLAFSMRFDQCESYEREEEKMECVAEQRAFDPDMLADAVAQTVVVR